MLGLQRFMHDAEVTCPPYMYMTSTVHRTFGAGQAPSYECWLVVSITQ